MAIPAIVLTLIKPISTYVMDYFNNAREKRQAQHATSLAIEVSKQKIIEQKLSNEHSLNTVRLQSTGKYFKYFTFIMWFGPFMLSVVAPEYSQQIFENLKGLPAWYVESCITIMFTVWSIAVSRETVQTIFTNLGRYMKSRREFKLQRKVVYDMLRVALKRPLEQIEVDTLQPILTHIEKEANK
tara:strand:- start:1105 stop:1656 length:552 start_codon:yes stop_codon:yes gene_type:complete